MKTRKCPDCSHQISINNYKRHIGSKACENNQKNKNKNPIIIQDEWLLPNGKYQCPHCEKEYNKQGLGTHIWRSHGDGQNFTANIAGFKDGTRKQWNDGLTLADHPSMIKRRDSWMKSYNDGLFKLNGTTKKSHKKAISEGMKRAHAEGRAHNIGQSRWNNEMSYPEKFFTKVIENEFIDKNYTNEYPVGIYSIDFAWFDKKLAIEIDGEQHEKPEYKARDKRKNQKLKSEGWRVLRIKWKDLYNDTKEWIKISKNFVDNAE